MLTNERVLDSCWREGSSNSFRSGISPVAAARSSSGRLNWFMKIGSLVLVHAVFIWRCPLDGSDTSRNIVPCRTNADQPGSGDSPEAGELPL